ncbi:hypothetical protein H0H81_011673 [Sphagnurus paluster]|uniref:Hydrophobin n=1 Tax=Sphagnurus paluster TaxID=117069 RepID=A0A9P7G0L9_9AGAR|nr:hypothetical protein H0H81_011673 [Sphagnurus paluster]
MFARLSTVILAALPLLAVAAPAPDNTNTCGTGTMACCNTSQQTGSTNSANVLSGLDFLALITGIQGTNAPVQATCSPINAAAIGGTQCGAQTICCDNNQSNALIAANCNAISL